MVVLFHRAVWDVVEYPVVTLGEREMLWVVV